MRPRSGAHPVLKWAGGKTQLLQEILPRLPRTIETYFEPFVGGGAVFFALVRERRFRKAVLADSNPELIEVYRVLQEDPEAVIRALEPYQHRYDETAYYEIREHRPRTPANRVARLIYLNKTGYNGLYRVNRSGRFNVPFGRYKNPRILDAPNLRAVSAALSGVTLLEMDFEQATAAARPGDAVYFDPPYLPLSKTASFAAYDRHPFGLPEHERLARVFGDLSQRGVHAVLSNSSTPDTRQLFAPFTLDTVQVGRNINCRSGARGPIDEILVTNRPRRASRR